MWRLKSGLGVMIAMSTIIILLITSVDIHAFNRDFFEKEYQSMNTASIIGMSQKDLNKATDALLDYLHDSRDHIKSMATIDGEVREVFNQREKDHMVDVKDLYQRVLLVRNIAIMVVIMSLIIMIGIWRKDILGTLAYRFMQVSLGFLVVIGMLSMWAVIDFYSFWTSFHQLFFTNDLWLLNPATDIMIQMFPQDFFFHMVIRIVIGFVIPFGLLFGGSLIYIKKSLKKVKTDDNLGGTVHETNHISE